MITQGDKNSSSLPQIMFHSHNPMFTWHSSKFNHPLSLQKELTNNLEVSYAPKKNKHGACKEINVRHKIKQLIFFTRLHR